jgi:hypothetical protein
MSREAWMTWACIALAVVAIAALSIGWELI